MFVLDFLAEICIVKDVIMKLPDYGSNDRYMGFETLVGKTLIDVKGSKGDETIVFTTADGDVYQLWHQQDCCESVSIEDICGEWAEIIGEPILKAEENSSNEWVAGLPKPECLDSFTWTYYRITTRLGQVVIRWYGTSNGYYSESVTFSKLVK